MPEDTARELAQLLAADGGPPPPPGWTVRCARLFGVDGIAVSAMIDGGSELMWFSDETSAVLDDLQFTLGEGPTVSAVRHGSLQLHPDMERSAPLWPEFAAAAAAEKVRAMFVFPLLLGTLRVGALTCYSRRPGPLARRAIADALFLSDDIAVHLMQLDEWGTEGPVRPADFHRAEVHQAAGMISVQLNIPLADAVLRLRAHAFAEGRAILDVCRDVIARRLRLASNGSPSLTEPPPPPDARRGD